VNLEIILRDFLVDILRGRGMTNPTIMSHKPSGAEIKGVFQRIFKHSVISSRRFMLPSASGEALYSE
jgi:hypothetical protein